VNEIREIKRRAERFHSKAVAIEKARDTIIDHANYLQTKLDYYRQYLENVKLQQGKKPENVKIQKSKPVKYTHKQLQETGVILDVDEDLLRQTKANFNNLFYYFSQVGPDDFEVEVKYKVAFGAKINPFPEPFRLSLSKLLEMQDANQYRYQLEMVTLHVSLLINLLNTSFVKKQL